MKNLFIPYKLAVIAKEKGFPNNIGSCLAAWEDTRNGCWLHFGSYPVGLLQAPLYQQIIDWFREKHNLHIYLSVDFYESGDNYLWQILIKDITDKTFYSKKSTGLYGDNNEYPTYYKALEKAIEEAFKLI